jgi:hypothetical protein
VNPIAEQTRAAEQDADREAASRAKRETKELEFTEATMLSMSFGQLSAKTSRMACGGGRKAEAASRIWRFPFPDRKDEAKGEEPRCAALEAAERT